ncbi:uridine phosphorylase 1-like isoform X2 [Amphiura filiformis]
MNGGSDETDGVIHQANPHLTLNSDDTLFHLGLSTDQNLEEKFGDVKFVCMGGSTSRMHGYAEYLAKELQIQDATLEDLCTTDRYEMYKVGPVLSISHGVGMPSISVLLHEVIKLLFYARCRHVKIIRIGTCGGLGLVPGTVVVSEMVVNEAFEPVYQVFVLGKTEKRPTHLDKALGDEIAACRPSDAGYEVVRGKTMCTSDFYEGQSRLDGAICDYTETDKMSYLQSAYDNGVRNIEMESACVASMCNRVNIKSAIVCVTLLNRLKDDLVSTPHDDLKKWEMRPQQLVTSYIKSQINSI